MYEVKISKKVYKFLEKRDKKFLEKFYESLNILRKNPFDTELDVKPLKWAKNSYRLRIGKYRILFTIQQKEIVLFFYDANSRGNIY